MRTFGKYNLIERIATGGMAEVWRAEAAGPEGFVKEVALKLVRGDHDACGEFVRMFIQEARLASRLTHANIVQVFDFDQVLGQYYLAMELVHGRTLRQVVERCGATGIRLGLARSVHVCAEVARALAYAHRPDGVAGLVHRDVSPQNVLLSFEGDVKLTDFGIARALGVAEATLPGTVKGKLAYMAPEQARCEQVDGRADVFSLGVMLWELCTGRRLFARESDERTLAALMSEEPISRPSEWNEAVPDELDQAVLEALSRSPSRRTPTAELLAEQLASIRHRLATGPEDLDLRALMTRLWPEGALPPARPALREPTLQLPANRGETDTADLSTRTVPLPGLAEGAKRRTVVPAVAAVVAVSLAVGVALTAWLVRKDRVPVTGPLSVRGIEEKSQPPPPSDAASPGAKLIVESGSERRSAGKSVPIDAGSGGSEAGEGMDSARPARPGANQPPETPATIVKVVRPDVSPQESPRSAELLVREADPGEELEGEPGVIEVHASPWAHLSIDGADVGEADGERRRILPGVHRLVVRHPALGSSEVVVKLGPGERYVWRPKLGR